jgi:hypothetical protein
MRLKKSTSFVALGVGIGLTLLALGGCSSAYKKAQGGDPARVFTRIYFTEFTVAWQATLEAIKSLRIDVSNREGGFIQTRWTENSSEKRFIDSYGTQNAYLKAQYRFRITAAQGFYNGEPSVKISVQKEQMVQRDVLEGWQPVETDEVEEKTLLYRIGRLITIQLHKDRIETEKTDSKIEESLESQ